MFENVPRNFADCLLGNTGEDGIAKLLEKSSSDSRCTICEAGLATRRFWDRSNQLTSNDHGSRHCISGSADGCKIHIHRINDALEIEGDFDI